MLAGWRGLGTHEDIRTKEEPVKFFRLRALALATEMGVDMGYASEAVAIFITAFGEAWLNDAAKDVSPSVALPFRRHPLGNVVSIAGATEIAEAFELSDYLRALQDSPQLPGIITDLKAQYRQALLHLAFAARLRSVGAVHVELEPPAAEGRFSDILFHYNGTAYRAECYRPGAKVPGAMYEEALRIAQDALSIVKDRPLVFSAAISLSEEPTGEIRRQVTALLRQLAEDVEQRSSSGETLPYSILKTPAATVSLCQTVVTKPGATPRFLRAPSFPEMGNTWSTYLIQRSTHETDVKGIAGRFTEGEARSQAAVWLPEDLREASSPGRDLSDPMIKLGRKIEDKLSQTRAESQELRLLIVDSWITGQLERSRPEDLMRLKRKVVDSHADVAGLLLVQRKWMDEVGRHGYLMHPLLPDSDAKLPDDLLDKLASIDRPSPQIQGAN